MCSHVLLRQSEASGNAGLVTCVEGGFAPTACMSTDHSQWGSARQCCQLFPFGILLPRTGTGRLTSAISTCCHTQAHFLVWHGIW